MRILGGLISATSAIGDRSGRNRGLVAGGGASYTVVLVSVGPRSRTVLLTDRFSLQNPVFTLLPA